MRFGGLFFSLFFLAIGILIVFYSIALQRRALARQAAAFQTVEESLSLARQSLTASQEALAVQKEIASLVRQMVEASGESRNKPDELS